VLERDRCSFSCYYINRYIVAPTTRKKLVIRALNTKQGLVVVVRLGSNKDKIETHPHPSLDNLDNTN
jgi:hypothetical protein